MANSGQPTDGQHEQVDPPRDPVEEARQSSTDSAGQAEGVHRAFDASNAPDPGPDRPISDEEREGTSPVDMEPEPAHGVGRSVTARTEDTAPDRDDVEYKGKTNRPAGEANPDGSGI